MRRDEFARWLRGRWDRWQAEARLGPLDAPSSTEAALRGRARRPLSFHSSLSMEPLEDRTLLFGGTPTPTPITVPDVPFYMPPQKMLFESAGYLTGPSAAAPITIAENYLRAHTADLGILPSDLNNYLVTTNYVTANTGATTLTFAQTLNGLQVFNANYHMTVTADGRLLNVGGGFIGGLSQHAAAHTATPAMNSPQAIVSAAGQFGLTLAAPTFVSGNATGGGTFHAAALSQDDITTKLRYVATATGEVALAWNMTVRPPNDDHWLNVDVDAATGTFVAMVDYVSDASYEVLAIPTESPTDGGRTTATDPQIVNPTPSPVPSPFGWHDTNGTAGAEFTITQGNNVNAYSDRDANDTPDTGSQPDGGAGLNFVGPLVPIDFTQAPSTYTAAVVTNLFYLNNVLHDVHYLYGFDEASGNFQVNNYGRGGTGNDAVNAEAQDGSGINNANFGTPPDGFAPTMQMYEFNLTNPNRDGDLDASIVIHEYGHGVSNRLTGNGSGLDALQSGGMGEGWGDFWALMFTQTAAADTTVGHGVATYSLGEPASGPGFRDFRYKFDIANPTLETFLNYQPGQGPFGSTEVHNSGTRWAATLWDLNHLMIEKYGYEPNIYNSTSNAGNIQTLHLVMDALKIQPLNPTFIQARDAILLADTMLNNSANHLEIWTAFARRGLGEFASTPNSDSETLVTSFEVPILSAVSLGPDVTLSEGNDGFVDFVFTINFTGTLNDPATVNYSTFDGTATAGVDYVPQSGSVIFTPNGATSATVTVQVLGDTLVEGNETFFVRLSDPDNTEIIDGEAVGTILNDDLDISVNDISVVEPNSGTVNAVFTITATGSIQGQSSVNVNFTTVDGSATAPFDYLSQFGTVNVPLGGGTARVTVPVVGDRLNEPTETFLLLLTGVTLGKISDDTGIATIFDTDLAPALYVNDVQITSIQDDLLTAVFTVALDTISGTTVTVDYATEDGTAVAGVDYFPVAGTLTFPQGTTTQQVSVQVLTSGVFEPNKTFFLNLFNPVQVSLADPQGTGTIVYAEPPGVQRILDDDDFGYTQSNSGWSSVTNSLAYQLDFNYHAAGTGIAYARWAFANLLPGTYQVFTKWIPFTNRATNAPYTIYDGNTPLSTVAVNQQLMPSSDHADGVAWHSLGTFQITTNSLAVRLTDAANGLVVADAVRIVSGGIGPQVPEIDVSGFGQSIPTGSFAPSLGAGTDFGNELANTNTVTRTFKIVNNGNAPLHLTGGTRVVISGANAAEFQVLAQPAATIDPARSASFQIAFHPTGIGLRQATVTIASDDANEPSYTFTVQGNGLDPDLPVQNILLPPDVNGNGNVSPADALLVINRLLAASSQTATPQAASFVAEPEAAPLAALSYYLDVSGDGKITPRDALLVINYLLNPHAAPAAVPQAILVTAAGPPLPGASSDASLTAVDAALAQLDNEVAVPAAVPVSALVQPASGVTSNPARQASASAQASDRVFAKSAAGCEAEVDEADDGWLAFEEELLAT